MLRRPASILGGSMQKINFGNPWNINFYQENMQQHIWELRGRMGCFKKAYSEKGQDLFSLIYT